MKTVLLLVVLYLAGCSGEDPYIEVSVDKREMPAEGGVVTVSISSDCGWTCTVTQGKYLYEQWAGEGTMTKPISVKPNVSFNDQPYTVTAKNQDGSIVSTCTFTQKERIGLDIQSIGMIPEEGGSFDMPVKTNDNITSVDTPDWITFTSSRALTGYTYTFTAEPNKTGAVRKGSVNFKGSSTNESVEVTQDSYTPTSVSLQDDLSYVSNRDIETRVVVEPEYADLSKLSIETQGCTASMEHGILSISQKDYGKFSVSFLSDGKEINCVEGEYIPSMIFYVENTLEAFRGQKDFLRYWYYTKDYVLHSSDESVVRFNEKGQPEAVGLGTAIISATHPGANVYDELEINVEPFLIEAGIGWFGETGNGTFDVHFAGRLEGPLGMTCSGFIVTDKNGYVKILNDGNISHSSLGELAGIVKIWTNKLNVSWAGYSNFMEALKGYQLTAEVAIDGKAYQRTVKISTSQVSY